jgi:hypothetical protein
MTSTSPESARPPILPTPGVTTPAGGVGLIAALTPVVHHVPVFYLAICYRCGEDLGVPFIDDEGARDTWAAVHVAHTGHTVQLTIDGFEELAALHMTGVITRTADGNAFTFTCPADECGRENGPYATPQLAIASWRGHMPASAR